MIRERDFYIRGAESLDYHLQRYLFNYLILLIAPLILIFVVKIVLYVLVHFFSTISLKIATVVFNISNGKAGCKSFKTCFFLKCGCPAYLTRLFVRTIKISRGAL